MTNKIPTIARVSDVTLKRGVVDSADSHDRFANADTSHLLVEGPDSKAATDPAITPEFTDHNTGDPGAAASRAEFGAGLDRLVFEPNSPGADDAQLVDNLIRRSFRISDPNDAEQAGNSMSQMEPFGHTIGMPHGHQPPVDASASSPPRLIILDEPASDEASPVDDVWF